jgi:hypothetical protein
VRRVGEQAGYFAIVKSRRYDGQVMQMAGAEPGVVGDVVIAGPRTASPAISAARPGVVSTLTVVR